MHYLTILLLTLSLFLFTSCSPVPAMAQTILGKVTYVYDGDTLYLQEYSQNLRPHGRILRLAAIDAPEKDQPYGIEAAQLLRSLVQYKTVLASILDTDKYGRNIAYIYLDNREINSVMLEQGAAWHYAFFDHDKQRYTLHHASEQKARQNKLGLWSQHSFIQPWVWRRIHSEKTFRRDC